MHDSHTRIRPILSFTVSHHIDRFAARTEGAKKNIHVDGSAAIDVKRVGSQQKDPHVARAGGEARTLAASSGGKCSNEAMSNRALAAGCGSVPQSVLR